MNKLHKLLLFFIIAGALVLRFYDLSDIPPGLHADGAAQGFNAFSILKTGKDMYGKSFPILFRANGSYQPPIYTYLTIIPTIFLGNSVITVRLISVLSGVGLVLLTYLLVSRFGSKNKNDGITAGLLAAAVVAISPWSIHFSRLAVEANLGVLIFGIGVYLLLVSLKNVSLFPVATLILGISTHAYYSERVIAVLLLGLIVFINRQIFLKEKKVTILGLGTFGLVLLPHFYLLTTGALTKRLSQVSYLGGAGAGNGVFTNILYTAKQFINHYLIYFSPKNLFFDPGSSLGRTTPDLGVLYPWMVVVFLIGLGYFFRNRKTTFAKLFLILLVIAPIPAGLTGDMFYPLRTLDYLWVVSIVVAFGLFEFWKVTRSSWTRAIVTLGLVIYSLANFGVSYFVIFKYELANGSGKPYIDLMPILEKYPDKNIMVDFSSRSWGVGIRSTYLSSADPTLVQKNLASQINSSYYSSDVNAQEVFRVKNISFETLNWNKVCGNDVIIVGDELSFDQTKTEEHKLDLVFTVPDYLNKPILFGYSTRMLCK